MTEPSIAAEEMDAILDDALDELDDSESESDRDCDIDVKKRAVGRDGPQHTDIGSATPGPGSSTTAPAEGEDRRRVPFGPPRPPPEDEKAMEKSLRKMFRDLAVDADSPPEMAKNNRETKTPTTQTGSPKSNADQSTVQGDEKMLHDLFQGLMAAEGGGNSAGGGMPEMDDIPELDNLFAGLGVGDGPDSDNFMDGMMEQLLSKELMYEPMKQVTEKFPNWLASKKDELAPEEWDQRNRQYDCFQRLVQAYESDNKEGKQQTAKLLEIMQEVQEYGQPPTEIINEIAPGLEMDEEGLPKMNGGMLPPFLGGNPGGEDCLIM